MVWIVMGLGAMVAIPLVSIAMVVLGLGGVASVVGRHEYEEED